MSFSNKLLTQDYFPLPVESIPYGDMLNQIFFLPLPDNQDFPIHGPNVIRFIEALVEGEPTSDNASGLIKSESEVKRARNIYLNSYSGIMNALEVDLKSSNASSEKSKVIELLKVAALYHDIGKSIRRANHPQIGSNLLRNFSEEQSRRLVDILIYDDEPANIKAKYNRFSLIASIIQHHDKFGVVCTGEGGLPLFSDIMYFTSDETTISGIKKNLTSVMLMNLADIAAVNVAPAEKRQISLNLAGSVALNRGKKDKKHLSDKNEFDFLADLTQICKEPGSCLGIDSRKVSQVLTDWKILIESIEHPTVKGNRVQMKLRLMELERNPARAIQRILRLLQESSETTGASVLLDHISQTSVESILVGTLGAHQFQTFCEQLSTVVKLDYGLRFFQAVLCACVRKEIHENYILDDNKKNKWMHSRLSESEITNLKDLAHQDSTRMPDLASKITTLFIRALESLVSRYAGVLNYATENPRRFGFQMRDLTGDEKIRDTIIDLLCIKEHKDPIALMWIVDEVTIWSMD